MTTRTRTRARLRVVPDALLAYRGRRLDGPLHEFHQAVDLLEDDTVPLSYYEQVLASQAREAEGRQAR
jgi:hypothetical protein